MAPHQNFEAWCADYRAGSSIPEISRRYRAPRSTVRKTLLALGVKLRTPEEGYRLAHAKGRGGRPKKID